MTALHPGPDESCDRICGDWHILQLRRGHRFSTDDLLCAWIGAHARPQARHLLDLGAGIGTVGLLALHHMGPRATLVMVEAQEISHQLARRTVAGNGLSDRVQLRLGDLRDPDLVPPAEHGRYDLVTGSPPYIPLGKGVVSPHPQRAACRMELRGDVFDYAATAARALHGDGVFALVHSAVDPRPEAALTAAGLRILCRQDVCFRRGRAPTIALWLAGHHGPRHDRPPLVVREPDGPYTAQYQGVRRSMGAP